jgi:hypothetical protein
VTARFAAKRFFYPSPDLFHEPFKDELFSKGGIVEPTARIATLLLRKNLKLDIYAGVLAEIVEFDRIANMHGIMLVSRHETRAFDS